MAGGWASRCRTCFSAEAGLKPALPFRLHPPSRLSPLRRARLPHPVALSVRQPYLRDSEAARRSFAV